MAEITELPQGWQRIRTPPALFRRFEFSSYDETRLFLDKLADISKETGFHPDLSFGRTYANVTISAKDEAPSQEDFEFARRANDAAGGAA